MERGMKKEEPTLGGRRPDDAPTSASAVVTAGSKQMTEQRLAATAP
jgi:hypothetical protein